MNSLTLAATKDDIIAHLSLLKIHALNLITDKIVHPDAKYMEPRELKTLTDTALSIEDSVRATVSEGAQARNIQRLLDKYSIPASSLTPSAESTSCSIIDIEMEE